MIAISGGAGADALSSCSLLPQGFAQLIEVVGTFLGLSLETQRDVLLMVVEEHLARHILERVETVGQFDEEPGRGIAIQIDVEDAVGISHQASELKAIVEEEI